MIIIHDKNFKNVSEIKKFTRQLLIDSRPEVLPGTYAFDYLMDLFSKRHPNWASEKVGVGISKIKLLPDKANPSKGTKPILVRKDNSEIDISWLTAAAGKGWSQEKCRNDDFRRAIMDQTMGFKRAKLDEKSQCSICNILLTPSSTHIDHVYPFSKLKTDFEKLNLADEFWPEYHRKEAVLRLTCVACNIKKSDLCT